MHRIAQQKLADTIQSRTCQPGSKTDRHHAMEYAAYAQHNAANSSLNIIPIASFHDCRQSVATTSIVFCLSVFELPNVTVLDV